ncbi:predicted protein [Botrytis cinerea T4]|uniref:Uncharacterized protein n=1 Tax=Botryotinia fuckeliana (strain T4) TaxID=999810 RepID=G2YJ93_BOTF4|nr:predicted protein [Botrytis cinerea T4]
MPPKWASKDMVEFPAENWKALEDQKPSSSRQPAQVSQHKDSGRVQDLRTYIDYHFSQGESYKRLADGYYSQAALEIQHNIFQDY